MSTISGYIITMFFFFHFHKTDYILDLCENPISQTYIIKLNLQKNKTKTKLWLKAVNTKTGRTRDHLYLIFKKKQKKNKQTQLVLRYNKYSG